MRQLLGIVERGQAVEAVVGNLGDADVRLARVAGLRRKMRLGQNAKQRCLAYLGQADNAGFHNKRLLAFSSWLLATARSCWTFRTGLMAYPSECQPIFEDK